MTYCQHYAEIPVCKRLTFMYKNYETHIIYAKISFFDMLFRKRILRTGTNFTFSFDKCPRVAHIEHLSVMLSLNYTPRAIMEMFIISPEGTKSKLLYERIYDSFGSSSIYKGLVITSVHFWGETSDGEWTVLFKASESLGSPGRPYGRHAILTNFEPY